MRKVGELMRRERGAADCRDCAILVTEVKRRGELVSIIYLYVNNVYCYWMFGGILQYFLDFFLCVSFL